MTQEEKHTLLVDLCARLPYHLLGKDTFGKTRELKVVYPTGTIIAQEIDRECCSSCGFVPYLRSMSSMTEEEILELYKITYTTWYSDSLYYKNEEWITFKDSIQNNALCFKSSIWLSDINKVYDWLNAHHLDYRGLIEKGLALEAPEGMYKIE